MSGLLPDDERLLARIRVVAAVVVLVLFAVNALEDNADISLLGMLMGAFLVLIGLAGADLLKTRNGKK